MINTLRVKARNQESANTIMSEKLKEAYALGWEILSRYEYETDDGYVIVVVITPQRKDESNV